MATEDTNVHLVCADRVLALTGDDPEVDRQTTAVAILGDRILATGDRASLAGRYPAAMVTDYGDATILPGFNDAHLHLTMMAAQRLGVDLSPETTPDIAALAQKVRDAAGQTPPGDWIRAARYDHTITTDRRVLSRQELDDLSPHHPLVIAHIGAHWAVVNSEALRLAGVDENTPDPPGGTYGRDAEGRLTGHLAEQTMFDIVYPSLSTKPQLTPSYSQHDLSRAIRESCDILHAAGLTSVGDAMIGPSELRSLQLARDAGDLTVRVNCLVTYPHLAALAEAGIANGFGDEWIRIGGIKAFADGAVAGHSCAVEEPFEDDPTDRGILTTDIDALHDLAERAEHHGLALAVHANGERAIDMLLTVFESLPPSATARPRHRIEHCSILTPQLVERIAALNLIVVPFCSYPLYHGDKLLMWYGSERLERMFAHRLLLDSGITVAASSDYPCGPLQPMLGLQSLVTRSSLAGAPVGRSQRISLLEAVALYTTGAASASNEASLKGTLAPGRLADLTVIGGDILDVAADSLGGLSVLATWVGGAVRYAAV